MTAPPARGLSLVEMMVGLAIGLFLLAVMGAVYQGSKSTFVAQESQARLQENARFAIDTLSADLRMAGFRGCAPTGDLTNTLATPASVLYDHARPAWAARGTGGGFLPALPAELAGLGALPNSDVLVLRRPVGNGWSLIGRMLDNAGDLPITPDARFARGDVLLVADCAGAAVLQATNEAPGTSGAIAHAVGAAGGLVPGLAGSDLGRTYAHDAQVWRLQAQVYYIAASLRQPGRTALWTLSAPAYDGAAARQELVTGVERLGLTLGLDSDADLAADRFVAADAVADWRQVVSARVELVLAAEDGSASTPQPYSFRGVEQAPGDRRLRTVVSALVSMRNTVP